MTGPRIASDASPYLFALYKALREGWTPPEAVSEEEYQRVKSLKDSSDPLTAFVGYGCSFGGKFFGGYARGAGGRSYAQMAASSLRRKLACCGDVTFGLCGYERLRVGRDCLVYCDPPYEGTTGYNAVGAFDHAAFWAKCAEWARVGAVVLVSEYKAPPEVKCVWQIETATQMHGEGRAGRTEKLFEVLT